MFLATFLVPLVGTFLTETVGRRAYRRWHAVRWSILPPLGVLLAALVPLGLIPDSIRFDAWLTIGIGAAIGALVALHGVFTAGHWTGPTPEEVARTGRRSAIEAGAPVAPAGPRSE